VNAVLETERLVLRRLTRADAPFMLEMLNDPAFIRNVADRGVRTVAEAENYLVTKMLPSYEQHGFGFYLVELKDARTPIGTCGLAKRDTVDEIDVGYGVLERYSGNGYATEAAAAVMRYARDVLGLERVVGFTSPINTRSIHVLQKLGLRYEKTIDLPGYDSPSLVFG
jgi:[ribosomal protein S5]-alanine N-acetyltransferase